MTALTAPARTGLVLGGYAIAFLLAAGVTWAYVGLTGSPERELSSGMYAFGDFLVFVAAFGAFSLVPNFLAVAFLREHRSFWIACSVVALAIAGTGVAEIILTVLRSEGLWAALAFPRFFVSPFLAVTFFLAALFAPAFGRWCLAAAAAVEVACSLYAFVHWYLPLFFPAAAA